jgi:hypothetical protein
MKQIDNPIYHFLYAIRHKETGMYFCSSRSVSKKSETGYVTIKTNLSHNINFYQKRPHESWYEVYKNELGKIEEDGVNDFVVEKYCATRVE